jgi:hypothetical protein
MEPEGSLLCLQDPDIEPGTYPGLDKSNPHSHTSRHVKLAAHRPHVVLFNVLCGTAHISNYIQGTAPNVPILINVKFKHMSNSYLHPTVLQFN